MAWGEVYKINSDMSLPLNELIVNSRKLCASSEIYVVIDSSQRNSSGGSYYTYTKSATINLDGSIRIIANLKADGFLADSDTGSIIIYKNGSQVGSITIDGTITTYTEEYLDVSCNKNDVFTFKLYCSKNYGVYCNSLKIGAIICIDGSGITIA